MFCRMKPKKRYRVFCCIKLKERETGCVNGWREIVFCRIKLKERVRLCLCMERDLGYVLEQLKMSMFSQRGKEFGG